MKTAPIIETAPGIYFCRTSKEATETLFKPRNGRTASGFYKPRKGGFLLHDMAGKPFAFLVNNRHGERFFVSCSRHDDGRIHFAFALSSLDEKRLGIETLSYSEERDLAESICTTLAA